MRRSLTPILLTGLIVASAATGWTAKVDLSNQPFLSSGGFSNRTDCEIFLQQDVQQLADSGLPVSGGRCLPPAQQAGNAGTVRRG